MAERCPLEKKVISYAFEKGVGLDEAAYKVLADTMYALSNHKVEGLYDRLFREESKND